MNQELRIKNSQRGFTFLEVIISLGIIMFILAAFMGVQILVRKSYQFSFNTHVTVDHANAVAQQMITVIRTTQPGDDGSFMLETLGDQALSIYSNVDDDTSVEKVRYFVDGNSLKQGIIEPSGFPVEYLTENEVVKILTEHVQNESEPLFYYYNGNWPDDEVNNPLASGARLANTRFVQLNIIINADPDRAEAEFVLSPTVTIRNLKDNLAQ